jgi:hypothetical protein
MRRTHATPLIGLGILGVVIGFLVETLLVGTGQSVLVPPVSYPITLLGVAVIIVGWAWPIRRAVQGKSSTRINPFQAMRIAALAKACTYAGAILTGAGIGIVVYLLTRSVISSQASIWLSVAATIGAAALLAGGLIAEWFCTLPPSDEEKESEGVPEHTPPVHH